MVVDDGSPTDRTAELARVRRPGHHRRAASGGKGQAMRVALQAAEGDLIAFIDGDVTNFGPHFVTGLLGPLLTDDGQRGQGLLPAPLNGDPGRRRPGHRADGPTVIDLLFPHLASIASHWPARRPRTGGCSRSAGWPTATPSSSPCSSTWPPDFGVETIAQVDLGVRVHRNRPLSELRPQATDILRASLARADLRRPDHR